MDLFECVAESDQLPVAIETPLHDPFLSNITRDSTNCDKTGTCYDGKTKIVELQIYLSMLI